MMQAYISLHHHIICQMPPQLGGGNGKAWLKLSGPTQQFCHHSPHPVEVAAPARGRTLAAGGADFRPQAGVCSGGKVSH